jgi:hypothetical protein
MHATIEELLKTVFSLIRAEVISGKSKHYTYKDSRVEEGSNTSTVALRVVEDDEKGTQCLGV